MYRAELHGKLSSKTENMEDILTSNVFSFFKYSNREIFLKGYLNSLGINISEKESNKAEFIFWPHYEDNTEPDLIIIVGHYYLLFEAKYYSEIPREEFNRNRNVRAQFLREIEGGLLEAKNYNKIFKLIAITADHYFKEHKYESIPSEYISCFKWTNWQNITAFLTNLLESNAELKKWERDFAFDLYHLLDRKNLRCFAGTGKLKYQCMLKKYSSIFYDARTSKFRGDFIGFVNSLADENKMKRAGRKIFYDTGDL